MSVYYDASIYNANVGKTLRITKAVHAERWQPYRLSLLLSLEQLAEAISQCLQVVWIQTFRVESPSFADNPKRIFRRLMNIPPLRGWNNDSYTRDASLST